MGDAAEQLDQVVDIVGYLRTTIAKIDDSVRQWENDRNELAARLAVLEAATDPQLAAASDEARQRIAHDRPYEGARDANDVITEAHRRFVTS